ncbi:MAG: CopG family ribbon-helix-helix protein [Rhodanobacteraceae bacterium]
MTIRLDADIKARLEALAKSTDRSRSWLAGQAIREFIDLNEWQVSEIRSGIEEADAGDFASSDEMASLVRRWLPDAD